MVDGILAIPFWAATWHTKLIIIILSCFLQSTHTGQSWTLGHTYVGTQLPFKLATAGTLKAQFLVYYNTACFMESFTLYLAIGNVRKLNNES